MCLASQACRPRSIGGWIRRIIWIPECRRIVRVVRIGTQLTYIVKHPTGNPTAAWRACGKWRGNQVRGTRAGVISPDLLSKLEVGDVLLRKDLVQESLAGDRFRRKAVVSALLVQLRQSGYLIAGSVSGLCP